MLRLAEQRLATLHPILKPVSPHTGRATRRKRRQINLANKGRYPQRSKTLKTKPQGSQSRKRSPERRRGAVGRRVGPRGLFMLSLAASPSAPRAPPVFSCHSPPEPAMTLAYPNQPPQRGRPPPNSAQIQKVGLERLWEGLHDGGWEARRPCSILAPGSFFGGKGGFFGRGLGVWASSATQQPRPSFMALAVSVSFARGLTALLCWVNKGLFPRVSPCRNVNAILWLFVEE